MPSELSPKLSEIILNRIEQAAKNIGAISVCSAIVVFGISSIFVSTSIAGSLTLATFGLCGILETFHVQRKATLHDRCQYRYREANSKLFIELRDNKPWRAEVVDEFEHGGFKFQAIGFDECKMPFIVTNPLCPACHEVICLETVQCKFPGRFSIIFHCRCGYSCVSPKTLAELHMEAQTLKCIIIKE